MNLRAILVAYRDQNKLTQYDMAKLLGISAVDYCRYTAGKQLSAKKLTVILRWVLAEEQKNTTNRK